MWVIEWSSSLSWWQVAGGVACGCALAALIFAAMLLIALKVYVIFTRGKCRSLVSLQGKTALITGASAGIGLETARDLARRGARTILACRDLSKANAVRDDLIKDTNNTDIHVVQLDLASLQSVRACAKGLLESERALHILVHNAGTAELRAHFTDDGLERTMATNYFGPFLFTILLSDLLKKSEAARIVIVASGLHWLAPLDVSEQRLNPPRLYIPLHQYYVSKLINMVWTAELARKFSNTAVTVNCLHPGMVRSEIYRGIWWPMRYILAIAIAPFFKNTVQGAQTTIHCAVSERLQKVSGRYFSDCREFSIPRGADDPNLGKKLWELSEKLVKLQENDPKI